MKFDFTKEDFEYLVEKLMLNDELISILEFKIKGYSSTRISLEMNMSERTVARRVRYLKKKIARVL